VTLPGASLAELQAKGVIQPLKGAALTAAQAAAAKATAAAAVGAAGGVACSAPLAALPLLRAAGPGGLQLAFPPPGAAGGAAGGKPGQAPGSFLQHPLGVAVPLARVGQAGVPVKQEPGAGAPAHSERHGEEGDAAMCDSTGAWAGEASSPRQGEARGAAATAAAAAAPAGAAPAPAPAAPSPSPAPAAAATAATAAAAAQPSDGCAGGQCGPAGAAHAAGAARQQPPRPPPAAASMMDVDAA